MDPTKINNKMERRINSNQMSSIPKNFNNAYLRNKYIINSETQLDGRNSENHNTKNPNENFSNINEETVPSGLHFRKIQPECRNSVNINLMTKNIEKNPNENFSNINEETVPSGLHFRKIQPECRNSVNINLMTKNIEKNPNENFSNINEETVPSGFHIIKKQLGDRNSANINDNNSEYLETISNQNMINYKQVNNRLPNINTQQCIEETVQHNFQNKKNEKYQKTVLQLNMNFKVKTNQNDFHSCPKPNIPNQININKYEIDNHPIIKHDTYNNQPNLQMAKIPNLRNNVSKNTFNLTHEVKNDKKFNTEIISNLTNKNENINNLSANLFREFIKTDFKGILDCDSVDEVNLKKVKIKENSDFYIFIGDNNDQNALYFQHFYTLFIFRKTSGIKNVFITRIENKNKRIVNLNEFQFSIYIKKINQSFEQFNIDFEKKLDLNDIIKSISYIKKTPPQDLFSFSRLICIYYRLIIIAYLFETPIKDIKNEYGITDIKEFINYLLDLSIESKYEDKIIIILDSIFKISESRYKQDFSKKFLNEKNEKVNFGLFRFEESNNQRSYYSIIPKQKLNDHIYIDPNLKIDNIIQMLEENLNNNK